MAIFFIDLNKLKEYNENMFQVEQNTIKNTIEQHRAILIRKYGTTWSRKERR
jgi:hypothetical protein